MTAEKMKAGALNALKTILEVGKKSTVLVVTDGPKLSIGEAFEAAAKELGAETFMYKLPSQRPMKQPPADLLELVDSYKPWAKDTVFINAFSGMAEETPIRITLIRREEAVGARVGHAPGITVDMMTEGPMNVDYRSIARSAWKLMKRFEGATKVHITAPCGTDITLDIFGRDFETDLEIRNGSMGNLPAGEIWCAPVEDGTSGLIVVDGSVGDLGAMKKPLRISVVDGRVDDVSGGTPAVLKRLEALMKVDDQARIIGELGIGLNPGARITGNLLEDEKAGKTAHIAFGNNTDMPGGKNSSGTHRDFLFHRPTIEVTYGDGRTETLLDDGDVTK
jgi:aminopeptidase